MAASLNRVFLMGNLTRDPELRYVPSGTAVASFDIAINRVYNTQSGEKKEETSFVKVVVWARRAEVCAEYLTKGSPVFVEGRLRSRSWETQDGQKRSAIEVVANNVQFMRSPSRQKGAFSEPKGAEQAANNAPKEDMESIDLDSGAIKNADASKKNEPEEEIPF
ncbi:MAG: single-stranded DNA-binding protein [Candidatus Omnitrophica bacterium]|nr:single-stranded DNA-binding protein [Candidatus Omnitrophota bacterium]